MIFGDIIGERTRMVGCWIGNTEDLKQRKVRAGKAWLKATNEKIQTAQKNTGKNYPNLCRERHTV